MELGRAERTRFMLEWIMDDSMRRAVHKCTTKIERHYRATPPKWGFPHDNGICCDLAVQPGCIGLWNA